LCPTVYFLIIEALGDPSAFITRKKNGESSTGTSPGRFTYTLERNIKFVKKTVDGYERLGTVYSPRRYDKKRRLFR
jgi:hypothetical protein